MFVILYTIVPMEVVLNGGCSEDVNYREVEYKGEHVEIAQCGDRIVLNRLYSTDPKKYLDPEFTMGKNIKNNEIKM